MGDLVKIQAVHHLCNVTLGIKANVSEMDEVVEMEKRKDTKLKDGTPAELIVSYMRCRNCGQMFSISYIEG